MPQQNPQILLARRPDGEPTPDCFELRETPIPEPGPGEVLVRHGWLSLDPYMRGRMSAAKSYAKPVEVGAVMEGQCVGTVETSEHPGFAPGDQVVGGSGWQGWSAVPGERLVKLPPGLDQPSLALGILGMPGLTAYLGMEEIGQPKPGETVVVSAATGAVGGVVGQLAKLAGARAVGVAGGAEKCRFAEQELGYAACIDHRAGDLGAALDLACPEGIDVYFENVGGAVQRAVFPRLRDFARMVMCGMVAEYSDRERQPGPNLMDCVRKRLRIQGFIVSDQFNRMGEWQAKALPLIKEGRLRYREDVVRGLENAPAAFMGLLRGENFGKLVVEIN
jgi:NADPH-dependent curcumin reductase CurA